MKFKKNVRWTPKKMGEEYLGLFLSSRKMWKESMKLNKVETKREIEESPLWDIMNKYAALADIMVRVHRVNVRKKKGGNNGKGN